MALWEARTKESWELACFPAAIFDLSKILNRNLNFEEANCWPMEAISCSGSPGSPMYGYVYKSTIINLRLASCKALDRVWSGLLEVVVVLVEKLLLEHPSTLLLTKHEVCLFWRPCIRAFACKVCMEKKCQQHWHHQCAMLFSPPKNHN